MLLCSFQSSCPFVPYLRRILQSFKRVQVRLMNRKAEYTVLDSERSSKVPYRKRLFRDHRL